MSDWRPGKRVAIAGGGPGAISTALAFLKRGHDVRVFERQSECRAMGGGVLLSTPVLAILRSYGMSLENVGSYTTTCFTNKEGRFRVKLPFNPEVERRMGIQGWHYGVLRLSAFKKMLDHTGIRLWLAWCDRIPGIPPKVGVISHDWQYQASFFPMLHDGKPGVEWCVVEPGWEGQPLPEDPRAHVAKILDGWAEPMPRLLEATDFDTQVYQWDVYNRPSMKKWSAGRVVGVGDVVHPVSPYAAYGMGMAIEDGYYLAQALDGVDLGDVRAVAAGFELYEARRVDYVNHHMEFARFTGSMFHSLPWPLAKVRDLIFDYTPVLSRLLQKDYLQMAEDETMNLKELHVM